MSATRWILALALLLTACGTYVPTESPREAHARAFEQMIQEAVTTGRLTPAQAEYARWDYRRQRALEDEAQGAADLQNNLTIWRTLMGPRR